MSFILFPFSYVVSHKYHLVLSFWGFREFFMTKVYLNHHFHSPHISFWVAYLRKNAQFCLFSHILSGFDRGFLSQPRPDWSVGRKVDWLAPGGTSMLIRDLASQPRAAVPVRPANHGIPGHEVQPMGGRPLIGPYRQGDICWLVKCWFLSHTHARGKGKNVQLKR